MGIAKMITLNNASWDYFYVDEIFSLKKTKGETTDGVVEGGQIPYIGATAKHNGLIFLCSKEENSEFISEGNCIVFIQIGAGGVGYATYHDSEFIGMSGKTICGYSPNLNKYTGLFLKTVLSYERSRYSFGRSWTGKRLKKTKIRLPACVDEKGKKVPDWKWMEDYIKSIYLTSVPMSSNKSSNKLVDSSNWQKFKIGDVFTLKRGKVSRADKLEGGDEIWYVGAKRSFNGLMERVVKEDNLVSKGKCLVFICDGKGSVGYVNYMDQDFMGTVNLKLGYNENLNPYNGLFIATVASLERPKLSYGRKWVTRLSDTLIKLPAKKDKKGKFEPDWAYMEGYIKSLYYGDCIQNDFS